MGKSKEVCSCKHVTKDEIREAVYEGATTFKDVKRATGAGSKCGKCRKKVEKIIEDELKEMEKLYRGKMAKKLGLRTQLTYGEKTKAAEDESDFRV